MKCMHGMDTQETDELDLAERAIPTINHAFCSKRKQIPREKVESSQMELITMSVSIKMYIRKEREVY